MRTLSAEGRILDNYQPAATIGCLIRSARGHRLAVAFANTADPFTIQIAFFRIESGTISRIGGLWQSPKEIAINGFSGDSHQFAVMYADLNGKQCLLESFDDCINIHSEGSLSMESAKSALMAEFIGYSNSAGIGCVLTSSGAPPSKECMLFQRSGERSIGRTHKVGPAIAASLSGDGSVLATFDSDNVLALYAIKNTQDGIKTAAIRTHLFAGSEPVSIGITPDGQLALVGTMDRCYLMSTSLDVPISQVAGSNAIKWAISGDGSRICVLGKRSLNEVESESYIRIKQLGER